MVAYKPNIIMKQGNTMIIRNGKIFVLQPVDDPLDDVCGTCDLVDLCMSNMKSINLLSLCEEFVNPDEMHFKKFKGSIEEFVKELK